MRAIELRRWTRGEYERMIAAGVFAPGERVELIEGEILQMTPQGSLHATSVQLVENALWALFGSGFAVRVQLPLALGSDSEPEPDVAVVPGNARTYRDAHPAMALLVVEVAESTLEYDRQRKGHLYAAAGISEYWIVNLAERCLEVHREPAGGAYCSRLRFLAGDSVAPLAAPDSWIQVADLLP